ncbi:hypothetical protein [Rhodococcus qingshengii]|uniref:hypothetical protein n=1 Tax=Rhodococcus qingshengii TaxID=334542 RepID=UPI001C5ED0ED|nr:hypothetical protein [Rhodococcus qingshengii]MBW4813157.1 hypothetical protein [Rhodococcus qingshengii]
MSVGMTEADHFYLPRVDQKALLDLLKKIPSLAEDLAVTTYRQDRIGKGGMEIASGTHEQPLPFNLGASNAIDQLFNELAGWARHVCDSRGIPYMPTGFTHEFDFVGPLRQSESRLPYGYQESVLGLARWLRRNIISLAMTEGADTAYIDISAVMNRCWATVDIPAEDPVPVHEKDEVLERVRARMLHRAGIVQVAELLARQYPEYRGLTANRVDALRKGGHIVADRCGVMTQAEIFCMGQVLEKHLTVPTRAKKVAA